MVKESLLKLEKTYTKKLDENLTEMQKSLEEKIDQEAEDILEEVTEKLHHVNTELDRLKNHVS